MADKNFKVKNGLESPIMYIGTNGVISWDDAQLKLQFSNDGGSTSSAFGSGGGADPVFQNMMYR